MIISTRFVCCLISGLWIASTAHAVPVRSIADLDSISFFERTGGTGPIEYNFLKNGSELTTLLADPLSLTNNDISGATTEYYDVYYSDLDGAFNLDGEFLTISGVFERTLSGDGAGGGLNLAEIALNFSSGPVEYGNYVASFFAAGDNAIPENVGRSIDGDLLTHTTMGNTTGTDQRLRVTLGFLSSSGPPPSVIPIPATLPLLGAGIFCMGLFARRKRRSA